MYEASTFDEAELLIMIANILVDKWKISYEELVEMSNKYTIFKMITLNYYEFNDMGMDGVINEIEKYVRKQGGEIGSK